MGWESVKGRPGSAISMRWRVPRPLRPLTWNFHRLMAQHAFAALRRTASG